MYKNPWLADCSDSCQISPTRNMYNFTVVSPTIPPYKSDNACNTDAKAYINPNDSGVAQKQARNL
jgi:hypothetical protein